MVSIKNNYCMNFTLLVWVFPATVWSFLISFMATTLHSRIHKIAMKTSLNLLFKIDFKMEVTLHLWPNENLDRRIVTTCYINSINKCLHEFESDHTRRQVKDTGISRNHKFSNKSCSEVDNVIKNFREHYFKANSFIWSYDLKFY